MVVAKDTAMDPETLSISLPAETAKMIRTKVESGAYASQSEVIAEALRFWHDQLEDRPHRLGLIRAKLDEAAEHPERITDAALGQHLDRLFDEYRLKQAK